MANKNAKVAQEATVVVEKTSQEFVQESQAPQFENLEWLKTHEPFGYFEGHTSSKYDAEREQKVQDGLAHLGQLNPLLLLLAKWWEVKPARSVIKKAIDAEAEVKGEASDVYMQVILKEEVEALKNLQSAIDRTRYAITYFKPRKPLSQLEPTMQVKINGNIVTVKKKDLLEAKELYSSDKEAMKEYLLSVAISSNDDIEEI